MKIKEFSTFCKMKWYLFFLMILGCALVGCLKGASIESWRKVGITDRDMDIMNRIEAGEDIAAPVFIGKIPLADEQNEFYSCKTAMIGALIGVPAGIVAMFVYYLFYDSFLWRLVRRKVAPKEDETELFLHF